MQASHPLPSWLVRLLFGLALGLTLFCPARRASAQQWEIPCSASGGSITIQTVTITNPSVAAGTLLGSAGNATVTFTCPSSGSNSTDTWKYFHLNSISGPVTAVSGYCWWNSGGCSNYSSKSIQGVFAGTVTPVSAYGGLEFATTVPGIAVLLTNTTGTQLTSSGGTITTLAYPSGGTSINFQAQLIATGATIHAGAVSSSSQLLTFENYWPGTTNSSSSYGSVILNPFTVAVSACSVNTDSQSMTVTLPPVFTSALTTSGATGGKTRFQINLTCNAGANASITMSTASYYGSSTLGVVAPGGTGYASNVGVQLLQSNGTTPVDFNNAQSVGTTPSGALSIPFYAQYYSTGVAGAGKVAATVTFTMSYQ